MEATQQEMENNVIHFIAALLNLQKPKPAPGTLGIYAGICQMLAEKMPQAPNPEAARAILRSVRKLKQNRALDDLLKRRFDSQPEQEQETTSEPEWTTEYTPLPQGIIPQVLLEPTGIVSLMASYVAYSKEVSPEGYEDFHELCFWGVLSILAARRICIAFRGKVYPSLYLTMVSKGAAFSKTETLEAVKQVLAALGLSYLLMPDRRTPQSLLSSMGGKYVDLSKYGELTGAAQELFKKELASCAQRGWTNDELGKFFTGMMNQNSVMAEFNSILLSLEKSPERYVNETITRGIEPIEKPYMSIIGCATPSNFRENNTKGTDLWRDGTYARFGFICPPTDEYLDIPFQRGWIPVPADLIQELHHWNDRLGERRIELTPREDKKGEVTGEYTVEEIEPLPEQALSLSDDAYSLWIDYRSIIRGIARNDPSEMFDSAYKRLAIRAVKLAALAASIEASSCIQQRHMVIALRFCEKMRASFHRLYSMVFEPPAKEAPEDKILKVLRQKGPLTARQITQYTHMTVATTRRYLETLVKEGEVCDGKQGRKRIYALLHEGELEKV
jgi:Protein of unknown function (DUF3987)/Bacterial regulatory protein, arsR family